MIGLRTSHRYIHKMINEAKSKISDEEFFISEAFAGYLEDIAEVVAKRYKRPKNRGSKRILWRGYK